jgi:indole-3-glycerol phosphate synthase
VRELDRVLKIDGVQLIGINNRSLGTSLVVLASQQLH